MYNSKKLDEATMDEIFDELASRAMNYDRCFLGEQLLRAKIIKEVGVENPLRDKILKADLEATQGPTVWMLDWIHNGRIARSKTHAFLNAILERERSK